MERSHRTVVTGVHRLQQIEGLRSTHLTDDDAFGTHAQAVAARGRVIVTSSLALEIGRARFEAHDVGLLKLKFGSVLAGDDALVGVNITGKTVQKRRLARAGTAGNQHVATHLCR